MRWPLAFLLLFLLPTLVFAEVTRRPEHFTHYGATFTEIALRVPGAKILVADYHAIRRDFPPLAGSTEDEINEWILRFAIQTITQENIRGVFHDRSLDAPEQAEPETTLVYHPMGYLRGTATDAFQGTETRGVVDLKGTGWGPEGEARLRIRMALLEELQGLETPSFKLEDEERAEIPLVIESHKAEIERLSQFDPRGTTEEARARNSHNLYVERERLKMWELYSAGVAQISADPTARDSVVEEFLRHLRSMDYMNGLGTAHRLLKEFLMQKAAQSLFNSWNSHYGTNYQTVDSYFVITLPEDLLMPNGQRVRTGIIGRQAHWRANDETETMDFRPPELLSDTLTGANQFDVFGAQVDWELPELKGPAAEKFGLDERSSPPLARRARDAVNDFLGGNEQAGFQLYSDMQQVLSEHPFVFPDSPESPSQAFIADLERVKQAEAVFDRVIMPGESDEAIEAALFSLFEGEGVNRERAEAIVVRAAQTYPQAVSHFLLNFIQREELYTVTEDDRTIKELRILPVALIPIYFRDPALGFRTLQSLKKTGLQKHAGNLLHEVVFHGLRTLTVFHTGRNLSGFEYDSELHRFITNFIGTMMDLDEVLTGKEVPKGMTQLRVGFGGKEASLDELFEEASAMTRLPVETFLHLFVFLKGAHFSESMIVGLNASKMPIEIKTTDQDGECAEELRGDEAPSK